MTLVEYLTEQGFVETFVELLDMLVYGYATLEDYQKNSSDYDEEDIGYLKTDIEDWEERLAMYKTPYKRINPDANWDEEIKRLKQ